MVRTAAFGLLAVAALGCSEDERMPIGPGNPASEYCGGIGYTVSNSDCQFPDGTSCDAWAFYRGECGTDHSYCNRHGGMISSAIADMGSFTAEYALCTMPGGAQCQEETFWRSGNCP